MKKIKPKNRAELRDLVKDNDIYLGDIDTSAISDMRALFKDVERKDFSGIESWDTSNVFNMSAMFYRQTEFNADISSWDVSRVKHMVSMFYMCRSFNQNLNRWNVKNVVSMRSMFSFCRVFDSPLND